MKNLKYYYLKPTSYPYLIIEYLSKYKWIISLFIITLILSYPSYSLINNFLDKNRTIFENKNLIKENKQLINKLKKLNINDQHKIDPLLVNKEIKDILIKNKADIEEMQWNKKSNNIDIIFNQRFNTIVEIINKINTDKKVYFNQIRLIKMNKNQLVNCVLNLTIL